MTTFSLPSQAAATPCLVLVTLVPTLALLIDSQARRLDETGAATRGWLPTFASVRCTPNGRADADGENGLLLHKDAV